jgi:hypothetical protein
MMAISHLTSATAELFRFLFRAVADATRTAPAVFPALKRRAKFQPTLRVEADGF